MSITTKGCSVTTGYTTLLAADSTRREVSIQNKTAGTLYLTVGGSTNDNDAITVPPGGSFSNTLPIGGVISAKSTVAGYVTILGDNLP